MKKLLSIIILATGATIAAHGQITVSTSSDVPTGYVKRITNWGAIHTEDGVLFMTYDQSISYGYNRGETLVKYPQDKEGTSYSIPDGVYTIAKGAFQGNKHLETIRIPSSVSYIGEDAFADCTNLKNIEIYNSSAIRDIEKEDPDNETNEVGRYNINGIKVDETDEGVQIILYGNGKAKKIIK